MECPDCNGTGESARPPLPCFRCAGTGRLCDCCGESCDEDTDTCQECADGV